jgi:CRISPR system Cascade subunit CasD
MRDYLVFTLAAALGSMGDVAGHERRGSWTWPGRSAVIGLMAAALGIRRDGDFAPLDALSVAIAVFDPGVAMRDYHTVQTVPTAAVRRPQSRPLALRQAGYDLNTTITLRDYRAGALYGVAVAGEGLQPIAQALDNPTFHLYLGRKSCPLAAPLAPRIVLASDASTALKALRLPPWWPQDKRVAQMLIADEAEPGNGRLELRHDQAVDRRLWHFTSRRARILSVDIRPLEAENDVSVPPQP